MDTSGPGAPTIYDVAERAGVSIATVSRVLNGRVSVWSSNHDRVLAAVEELRFVPNGAARGLSQGLKQVVGIVFAGTPATDHLVTVEEESLLFTDAVVRGAEAEAQRLGYSLLLNSAGPGTAESNIIALTGKVDGLVLLDRVLPERRVPAIARRTPVVLLAGSGTGRVAYTVRADNTGAMQKLAEHLVVTHRYRRLAYLSGLADSPDNLARSRAFVDAATGLGAKVDPLERWQGDWTSEGARQVVATRIKGGGRLPDAIACANDQMALGVFHAVSRSGRHVPDDVAVVGFDDISVARHLTPPLTTVRQPSRQLGAAAVEVLVGVVEGHPPARRDTVLPTTLKVRGSCGCPPERWEDARDTWRLSL